MNHDVVHETADRFGDRLRLVQPADHPETITVHQLRARTVETFGPGVNLDQEQVQALKDALQVWLDKSAP